MNYKRFSNLSCYEEFEIQCDLLGISKLDILKKHGNKIDNYYFFISNDGIFNWYDLSGNHTEDPGVLREIKEEYIPITITKCIIPDSVTSIGYWAFLNCKSLKEITIPDCVTSIRYCAFYKCRSLTSITIPNSVTIIGKSAFSSCESLTSITIPDNVINIGYNAFSNCKSLDKVIFRGKILDEVKQMETYPFGIKDESIIKCEI